MSRNNNSQASPAPPAHYPLEDVPRTFTFTAPQNPELQLQLEKALFKQENQQREIQELQIKLGSIEELLKSKIDHLVSSMGKFSLDRSKLNEEIQNVANELKEETRSYMDSFLKEWTREMKNKKHNNQHHVTEVQNGSQITLVITPPSSARANFAEEDNENDTNQALEINRLPPQSPPPLIQDEPSSHPEQGSMNEKQPETKIPHLRSSSSAEARRSSPKTINKKKDQYPTKIAKVPAKTKTVPVAHRF